MGVTKLQHLLIQPLGRKNIQIDHKENRMKYYLILIFLVFNFYSFGSD